MDANDVIAMRTTGKGLDNDGSYWSEDHKRRLNEYFTAGMGITTIALLLGRSEPAIVQQLTKGRLFEFEIQPRKCRVGKQKCRCRKCDQYKFCPFSPKNRKNPIISTKGDSIKYV